MKNITVKPRHECIRKRPLDSRFHKQRFLGRNWLRGTHISPMGYEGNDCFSLKCAWQDRSEPRRLERVELRNVICLRTFYGNSDLLKVLKWFAIYYFGIVIFLWFYSTSSQGFKKWSSQRRIRFTRSKSFLTSGLRKWLHTTGTDMFERVSHYTWRNYENDSRIHKAVVRCGKLPEWNSHRPNRIRREWKWFFGMDVAEWVLAAVVRTAVVKVRSPSEQFPRK